MRNRGTTALIALFFAGLVGLWAAEYLQVPSAAERDRHKGRVLVGMINVKPDDLRKIEIDGGATPLVFERRDGRQWQMTAPLDVAADPSLVEGFAFRLKELTRKPQADTLKGDLASFGLAPPSRTIRLWGQSTDAPLATLDLGNVSLDRRFVRPGSAGAGVEVVPAQGLEVVDLPPVRWRDRELFRVPSFEVDAVQLTAPGRNLRFERGPDAWRIVEPFPALAVESKVEGLIASIGSLRVTNDAQFVANDVTGTYWERYGLMDPTLTITVSAGRGPNRRPEQVLKVGKPVEGQPDRLYVRVGDQNDLIAIDARVLTDLAGLDPNSFRSEKVADIAPNRATRFRVEAGAESFEIARSGNTWFVTRPSLGRADPKAVQEFFQGLEGLRSGRYLPPSPETIHTSGLDNPGAIIQVWQAANPATPKSPDAGADDSPTFTLKVGSRDAGKKVLYAQVGGDPAVLALPDTAAANLFKKSWAFRDRLILTAATDQIERIRFDGLGKQVTIQAPPIKLSILKNAATGWWLSEPVVALADDGSVAKLLKLLTALRVDGYAAESPTSLADFGLDAPTLKVTWSVPAALPPSPVPLPPVSDPTTRRVRFDEQTLVVGNVVPDRKSMRYAMLGGHPVVFMLGGETLATLDAEWHDHRIAKFDPALIDKIHLAWPGTDWSFDLARTEANTPWSIVGPVDVPGFDPQAAAAVLNAAADLSTPRYSQYRGAIPSSVGLTPPRLTLRFSGPKLAAPEDLAIGAALATGQSYASAPNRQPGAVFLIANPPFVPWLKLQPPIRDNLPDDVFLREPPSDPAPAPGGDGPGQTGGQPR